MSLRVIARSRRNVLPSLPTKLAKPFTHMPFFLQSSLLKKALKHTFAELLEAGEVDFLQEKWLKVAITDLNVSWNFSCSSDKNVIIERPRPADVTISGPLNSFILLAAQKEDPDTLFFQRDLLIQGDTELGLEIKNLLDAIAPESLPPELRFALKSAAEYVSIFTDNLP